MTLDKTQTIGQYLAALPENQRESTKLLLELVSDGCGWVAGIVHNRGVDGGATGLASHGDPVHMSYALTVVNAYAYKAITDSSTPLADALTTEEDTPCDTK